MDGNSRITLHSVGLNTVYGLTLDYDNQILYWADYSNNRIEMSFTNGSNRNVLTSSGIADPFAITYYAGKLYWTDWSRNRIYTLSINSPSTITQVTGSLGQDPYGIRVVTKERQPDGGCYLQYECSCCIYIWLYNTIIFTAPNSCLGSNCSHICLLSANDPEGYVCSCPPSLALDSNLKDCKGSC